MQINSVSTSVPVAFSKPASSPQGTMPAEDKVSISSSGDSFTRLVSQVNQMPEVRNEIVDAYKVRIQNGYPAPLDIEGLVNLMGPSWSKMASASRSN